MKDKLLYYAPEEISVNSEKYVVSEETFETIQNHQISGLIALGGVAINHDEWTHISNPAKPESKFLNRVLGVKALKIDGLDLPCDIPIEVNRFSLPVDIEDQLVASGALHTGSHFVLGRPISNLEKQGKETKLNAEYSIVNLDEATLKQAIEAFNSFFVKSDENNSDALRRMSNNLTRGPHLAVKYKDRPIAVLGAILHNKIGCLYSFIVAPEHRNTELLASISKSLVERLSEMDINYIYSKSNNKAVVLGSRYTTGMSVLYADRIYEKK